MPILDPTPSSSPNSDRYKKEKAEIWEERLGFKRPDGMSYDEWNDFAADWWANHLKQQQSGNVYENRSGGANATGFNTGGSSGGGGGGAARQGLTRTEIRMGLSSAGFTDIPFNIDDIVDEAVRRKKDVTWVIGQITRDSRFKRHFRGIMDSNGVLRMSPAEWQGRKEQYRDIANQYGYSVSNNQVGTLISGEVSAAEFEYRARAAHTIQNNSQVFAAVNEVLAAYPGVRRIESPKDAFDFVTGRSQRQVYDIYEDTVLIAGAAGAGLDISARRADQLSDASAGQVTLEEAEERYARIASQLKTAGVELSSFGINQRQLEVIEFGGTNRARLADAAERALRQRQAQLEAQTVNQSVARRGGRPVLADATVEAGY